MKLPESWLLLELVYDEKQGFFGAARWDRYFPTGIFVPFPSEQWSEMKRLLEEFAGIMAENEGSFVVNEAFRHDRRYIQTWWQRRKSIDFRLREWQRDLESHFCGLFCGCFSDGRAEMPWIPSLTKLWGFPVTVQNRSDYGSFSTVTPRFDRFLHLTK